MRIEGCNMAAETNNIKHSLDISAKIDRDRMNKLRDCGLEYVSTSGRLMPAKTQPGKSLFWPKFGTFELGPKRDFFCTAYIGTPSSNRG